MKRKLLALLLSLTMLLSLSGCGDILIFSLKGEKGGEGNMKKLLEWYKKRKENLKGYNEHWRVRFA